MKILSRLLTLGVLVAVLTTTSCNTESDNPTIWEQSFPGFFANVNEYATGATAVYSNLSYKVTLNYTDWVADVQISGLKLPDGTTYPTMTLRNMNFSITGDGWNEISGRNITPEIGGFANVPTFTQFKFRIYGRFLAADYDHMAYSPAVCATYVVNGLYSVLSSYSPQILFGTTVSTDITDNSKYESDAVTYTVAYNTDTRTLTIGMNGIRFSGANNDGFDMELRNIPLDLSGSSMKFNTAYATPYVNGTVFESYAIADIKGEFNPGEGLKFGFGVNPRNSESPYRVEVDCDFARTAAY